MDEDDVGVDDASANKNDICVDLDGDDATKKVTNEEEKSNEYSKSNTPTKSDQVDETAKNTVFSSSTSMGEDYCRASSDSLHSRHFRKWNEANDIERLHASVEGNGSYVLGFIHGQQSGLSILRNWSLPAYFGRI